MIVVENARSEDIPALVELLRVLFSQERDFAPDADRQRRGLELILAAPQAGQIFVARAGNHVVGMVSLLFTISTALGAPVCWLEDMIVHPDNRDSGTGTKLISHALCFAASHGYARVSLLTDGVNADARRFYGRLGFTHSDMVTMRHLLAARSLI